jgi:hypothetical protein
MADKEPSGFAGIKLRGGLPSDNGLVPLADELVNDKTRIVYFVAAAKVADIVEHVDNGTKTSVLKIIGIEADLVDQEIEALRVIQDRARVRRTGEQPLFDTAEQPDDVRELVAGEPEE